MTLQSLLSARTPLAASPGVPANSAPGVTINSEQILQQAYGARIRRFFPKYTNVPARITDPSADNRVFFERNGMQISHTVYIGSPGGGPVTMQISQGDTVQYGQRYFEVQGVRNPDHLNRYLILGCLEKTPGLGAAAFPQP